MRIDTLLKGDFCVERSRRGVLIAARDERTMLWLQYQLMKSLAGGGPAHRRRGPAARGGRTARYGGAVRIRIPGGLYPAAQDDDLAGILSTDNVETGWGLWGHQLDRVLADAPKEVFATVGGETCDGQFCFSSDETFRRIEEYVADNFGEGGTLPARFVIAPADNDAICTCEACSAAGNTSRTATPAVMRMLGRLAARFPHHTFFTLGYLSTGEPPAVRMPANTGVIVSAMELPLSAGALKSASGKKFAVRLDGWKDVTDNVYIWDYIQNFDDYLTPFPVLERMGERLRFYRDKGSGGHFSQRQRLRLRAFRRCADLCARVVAARSRPAGRGVDAALYRRELPEVGRPAGGVLRAGRTARRGFGEGLNLYGGIRDAEASWLDAAKFAAFTTNWGASFPRRRAPSGGSCTNC